jgi:suppressor of ftsI
MVVSAVVRGNADPDIGNFVFHCHILEHEDGGMMNIIQVVPATAKKSDQKALPDGGGL